MSPELIVAIRDRIAQSQPKEEIKNAVLSMGHSEEIFEAAYTLALHDTKETIIEAAEAAPIGIKPLPRVSDLMKDSFNFVIKRLDLAALLIIPSAFMLSASTVLEQYEGQIAITITAVAILLVAFVVYVLHMMAVLFVVANNGRPTYKPAIQFAFKNLIPFLALSLVLSLVLWGGLIMFIIPGLIVGVSTYFAQLVFIHEGQRGMSALLASRAVVSGRWWLVAGKLCGIFFWIFIPIFFIALLLGGITSVIQSSLLVTTAGDVLVECFVVVGTIMSLFATNRLYLALRETTVTVTPKKGVKARYWFLVVMGLLMTVLIIVALAKYAEDVPYDLPTLPESVTVFDEISSSQSIASSYFDAHGQSYEGVCESLQSSLFAAMTVTCNDEGGEWALSASDGFDTWCADKLTTAKRIQKPLETRVHCLDLPQ
jgi:hypothetical protein